MSKVFNKDTRFSIILPDIWEELGDNDQAVFSFIKKINPIGALQISLAKRTKESIPTESECISILENHFEKQGLKPGIRVLPTKFGLMGHAEPVTQNKRFLITWLLLSDLRMAFVTYNCPIGQEKQETTEVQQIVDSFEFSKKTTTRFKIFL